MTFTDNALEQGRPESIRRDVSLPRRQRYYPSPADWRDEVLYFLLVDRFSGGQEDTRPPLDQANLTAARPEQEKETFSFIDRDRWNSSPLLR